MDKIIIGVVIIFGLFECILSLKNLNDLIPSQKMAFELAGTFDNPGLLGNYIAAIFPFALSNILLSPSRNKTLKYLSALFIILGLIVLVYLLTRAAWIATIVGIIIVFECKFHIFANLLKTKIQRIITFVVAFICIIIAGIGMYKLNPESVKSRIFISKVTIKDYKNNIVFGNGIETFSKNYNLAQIDYFKNKCGTEQELDSAISVNTCFNEYLLVLYEAGAVGLFGIMAIILILLLNYKRFNNYFEQACFASLLSILVAAMFSYPLHNFPTIILLIISISVLSRKLNYKTFHINRITLIFILCFILFNGYFISREIQALTKWKESFNNIGNYEYSNLYTSLSCNKYFLYNYGLTLINSNDLDESLKIMTELTHYHIDDVVLSAIAAIYLTRNDLGNAEKYYLLAYYASPSKIYPLSRLVDIYYAQGEYIKADMIGNYVLNKRTKINSAEVMQIKENVESIINLK